MYKISILTNSILKSITGPGVNFTLICTREVYLTAVKKVRYGPLRKLYRNTLELDTVSNGCGLWEADKLMLNIVVGV